MLYILLNTLSHDGLSMRGVYLYVLSLYVILLLPKSAGTAQDPVVPVLGDARSAKPQFSTIVFCTAY